MTKMRAALGCWLVLFCIVLAAGSTADANSRGCRVARRIVGGFPARIEHWPGFAALRLYHADHKVALYFCGGSAISPSYVMTAAHCFNDLKTLWRDIVSTTDDFSQVKLQIVLGADNLDKITKDNVYDAETWFQHEIYASALVAAKESADPELPEHTAERVGHDIALVKLSSSWNGPLSPLSLTKATDPTPPVPVDELVMVAGFGSVQPQSGDIQALSSNGEKYFASTPELLEVALPFVDIVKCRAAWSGASIGAGQICAGFEVGRGKDSCNGDSGGPLVSLDDHLCPRQIGLVSWGASPCAPGKEAYGVYTRISTFVPWLKDHVPDLKE